MVRKYLPTFTYLLLCFIVSIPFNYANFRLLYPEDGIPAGADSATHTYFIMNIVEKKDPLVHYTAFPTVLSNTTSYYPSLMHLAISALVELAALDHEEREGDPYFIIEVERSFMLAATLAGTVGYSLLLRAILTRLINDKMDLNLNSLGDSGYSIAYLTISILAFGIFIYSVSPIVQTYNDGSYTHIFSIWTVLPFYLFYLVNKHWIRSAVLLAVIASVHNIGFLMSLSATAPYIISLLIQRSGGLRKNLLKFAIVFLILFAPSFILFYFPVVTTVQQGGAGEAVYLPWPIDMVIQQLKPGLFYLGIICIALAFILNYKVLGWLSAWALIYFIVFDQSSVLGERFGRGLSIVLGLTVGTCISYLLFVVVLTGKKWIYQHRVRTSSVLLSTGKLILLIGLTTTIMSVLYLYFEDRFQQFSDPNVTKYYTEEIDRSNKYFLTLENKEKNDNSLSADDDQGVIALYGDNPWLRVTTYGKFEVLGVLPTQTSEMGKGDSYINYELDQIFTSPDLKSSACNIKKYDIDYIYISDRIPGRFYNPYKVDVYYRQLNLFQSVAHSPFFHLEAEFSGIERENIRIYSINKDKVHEACNPISAH